MAIDGFAHVDFDVYHRDTLPALLGQGHGAEAAKATAGLAALAFRLPSGDSYTYTPSAAGIAVAAGDADAATIIEIDPESWEGLTHDYESAAGLLYGGRVQCARGGGMQLIAWEPALRAMYAGRPIFDPGEPLRDAAGRVLDPERSFTSADSEEEMAEFLQAAGYLMMRGLFDAEEIGGFLADADALRLEAVKGDELSWWGTQPDGAEFCSRVTRAIDKPRLATLFGEPRLQRLADLADAGAKPRMGEGTGVTCVYKHPGVEEGLSDLPWHRDCGMGGHALMCPTLITSVYLTPMSPETGELRFLPGSARASSAFREATDPQAPQGIGVRAQPGDVTIHFGDVMHAAPPPTGRGLDRYRVSALCGFGRPDFKPHTGEHSYNQVLHGRGDGQIEHLSKVAGRA